jgi:hypothetical protein
MQYYKELYQERVAIMEYDGGLEREEAEAKALFDTKLIFIQDKQLKLNNPKHINQLIKFEREVKKE